MAFWIHFLFYFEPCSLQRSLASMERLLHINSHQLHTTRRDCFIAKARASINISNIYWTHCGKSIQALVHKSENTWTSAQFWTTNCHQLRILESPISTIGSGIIFFETPCKKRGIPVPHASKQFLSWGIQCIHFGATRWQSSLFSKPFHWSIIGVFSTSIDKK